MKRILFIGHSAGYTGAPIVLLRLINWISQNTDFQIRILLKDNGPLRASYEKIAPVTIYNQGGFIASAKRVLPKKITNRLKIGSISKQKLIKLIPPDSIDLIFTNTITNGEILYELSYLNCPVLCRVAELNYWIHKSGSKNIELIKNHVTHYIAVAEVVKDNLLSRLSISESNIDVVHGFIPAFKQPFNGVLRKKFNITKDSIVVGGSGAEFWRKGMDIFIQIAVAVVSRVIDISFYFVWVGGKHNDEEKHKIDHDISSAGLSGKILFIPEVPNPLEYFIDFDIFTMVSREDPYPLVNLEVASLSVPVLCFKNAGGSTEFVENDAGFIIPYLDINAMADKVILLAKDKELRMRLGRRAAEKVKERHDNNIAAPKIHTIMTNLMRKE